MKVKIKDLQEGQEAVIVGELFKKTMKTSKGDPYYLLQIKDNTGKASQQVWNNLPLYSVLENFSDGDYVEAKVTCTKTEQYININVHSLTKLEKTEEPVVNEETLKEELRQAINEMKDEHLKQLVINVLNRPDVRDAFFQSPASMMSGYSFNGGLVAHIVRSIRLAKAVANVFNGWNHNIDHFQTKLNEDLLVASCILHDIGKIRALRKNGLKVEKTAEGELFEDSYITLKIVSEELNKVQLPEEQRLLLEHVLGAAKGKQTYGALFLPRSREAVAFHLIDMLDVQMANFEYLDRNADASDMFVQLFQKTLFLGLYDE